ncbi:hypothetical protein DPMN_116088 [Dreissena polymorpha]|uniref:DUF4371 domain-containing protein n=1 Tax=Dreissena polymorpha TaxID=45954 RepID=A0A9D4KN25_DREPO|nr:hypothetical protein DPMN_116088 [Dreissena polymorpha]
MLLGFMAEHNIPYSMKLCQALGSDPKALNAVKMERTTSFYKMTHGLNKFFESDLVQDFKDTPFCLNIDESTNSKEEKVVSILVSYIMNQHREIVVRHVQSFKVVKADAHSIYDGGVSFSEISAALGELVVCAHGVL